VSYLLSVPENALLLGHNKDKVIKLFYNSFIKATFS